MNEPAKPTLDDVPGIIKPDGRKAVGPDTARYWAAASGHPVPKPFHLRWLLPKLLGPNVGRWWAVWVGSWVVLAAAMFGWTQTAGFDIDRSLVAVVLLLALPGILGPVIAIPVQCDLPATALVVCGVWLETDGHTAAAIAVLVVAATLRELSPLWAAIIATNPVLLAALAAPVIAGLVIRTGPDPLGDRFAHVNDHPIKTAWAAHRDKWRDAWVMVAPWGICLAAFYDPPPELWVLLVLAYTQLLVATDSVRLYQHAAGPLMAFTAAAVIPTQWLVLAAVGHVCWWVTPQRV